MHEAKETRPGGRSWKRHWIIGVMLLKYKNILLWVVIYTYNLSPMLSFEIGPRGYRAVSKPCPTGDDIRDTWGWIQG